MAVLRFFRSLLVILSAVLSTLAISLGALFMVHVMGRSSKDTRVLATAWGKFVLFVAGVRVAKRGGGSLDPAASYIFAVNHQSQFDIFVLSGYLGHSFNWMAKKELFAVPVWGSAMRAAGDIPVDRSRGREALKSLAEAAERIASGTSVVIFPEGTRSPDGRLGPFKSGGMALAIKAGVPVVPVAVKGTHDVLPKGRLLARAGAVTVSVGDPVEVSQFGPRQKQELADRIQAEVAKLLREEGPQFPVVEERKKD